MRLTAIALVLCAATPSALADEIHLFNGKPRKNVTIVDETFEEVSFKMPGVRVTQTLRADQAGPGGGVVQARLGVSTVWTTAPPARAGDNRLEHRRRRCT